MKLKTAQRLQREVAFCEQLLKEKEKHFQEFLKGENDERK